MPRREWEKSLQIIQGDVLKVPLPFFDVLVANVPYNVRFPWWSPKSDGSFFVECCDGGGREVGGSFIGDVGDVGRIFSWTMLEFGGVRQDVWEIDAVVLLHRSAGQFRSDVGKWEGGGGGGKGLMERISASQLDVVRI